MHEPHHSSLTACFGSCTLADAEPDLEPAIGVALRTPATTVCRAIRKHGRDFDHLPAIRVFAGLAVPGMILIVAGRTDLLMYAVFGSFTGMYGFAESTRKRLVHQCEAAVLLLSGVGAGIVSARLGSPPWVLVVSVAMFAAVTSPIIDRLGLRPPGPFFGIFAFGAVAMVADVLPDPLVAFAVCAATAALGVAVGFLDALRLPRDNIAPADRTPPPVPRTGWPALVQAFRYALAIGLAGGVGLLLGVGHANWAMAGAAVPLAAAQNRDRVQRAVHRIVGTFAGLVVTVPLLVPEPAPAVLALAIIALLYPTELFMARHYAVALGFFTPLIMAMTVLAEPAEPWHMLSDRAVDTVLGVAIGVAVAFGIPELRPPRFRRRRAIHC